MTRSDYRVMHWYGDMDGPWSDSARDRYLAQGYNGLSVLPTQEWVPEDLSFVRELPNLRYLSFEWKLKNDADAFMVDTLEELSLVTGSSVRIPEVVQPRLIRLCLTDRKGLSISDHWPRLRELRLGNWRGTDFSIFRSATELRIIDIEGRGQAGSLEGIQDCRGLEVFNLINIGLSDLAPLVGVTSLRELKLMTKPGREHLTLDLSNLQSPHLEKLWISHATRIVNLDHLMEFDSIRNVRLINCNIDNRELENLGSFVKRIEVL